MTAVSLGATFNDRAAARTPQVLVKNLVPEFDETNLIDKKAWITRPGTALCPAPSGAAYRGAFQQDGLFSGDMIVAAGSSLYRLTSGVYAALGTISGIDTVSFTASASNLMICAGQKAYIYDGTTLTAVTMPSGEGVGWIAYLAGYFLIGVVDSQHIFFLVDGASPPNPDALDYFSAATNAGNVLRGMTLSDQLVLFGQIVTEFWQASGDANLPFSRIVGMVYQKGIASEFCAATLDNTIFFIGNDLIVYRCASIPQRVSTNAVEEKLRQSISQKPLCWSFGLEGHPYFVLTIPGAWTLVYDASTQEWLPWQTGNDATWNCQYGIQIDGTKAVAGTPGTPGMRYVSPAYTDDAGTPIVREIMGGVAIVGAPQRCDNFSVVVDAGGGTSLIRQMEIDLRWSDDQGQTFTPWVTMAAGTNGQYSVQPAAFMLGMMRYPLRVFHLRSSVLGPFRISYARVNEYFASPLLDTVIDDATATDASIRFINPPISGHYGSPVFFFGSQVPDDRAVEIAWSTSGTTPPQSGWTDAIVSGPDWQSDLSTSSFSLDFNNAPTLGTWGQTLSFTGIVGLPGDDIEIAFGAHPIIPPVTGWTTGAVIGETWSGTLVAPSGF